MVTRQTTALTSDGSENRTIEVLEELIDRMDRALADLDDLAAASRFGMDARRLQSKRAGVYLARSYTRNALRIEKDRP